MLHPLQAGCGFHGNEYLRDYVIFIDFNTLDLRDYATDVCIIGAGVAGITLARRLLAAGRTVTMLESGGIDYEPDTADLNAGESVGQSYYPLDHARLRLFGGTTAIWGGRVAELDRIDFERRSWVPHSGWPISYDDLQPYYNEARSVFGMFGEPPHLCGFQRSGGRLPDFDQEMLAYRFWSFDRRPNRFTYAACKDLIDHPQCTILTYANVTALQTDGNRSRVRAAQVRSLRGKCATVHGRVFVLAAGGIENPRLLLASGSAGEHGLGNRHDLVGRFFMEHPHARAGHIQTRHVWPLLQAFTGRRRVHGQEVAALIAAGRRLQEQEGILNTSLTIAPRQPAGHDQFVAMRAYSRVKHDLEPSRVARALWLGTKKAAVLAQKAVDPARPWLLHKMGRVELALLVRAEQAPNPDSRVTLSNERDALGMPRVRLDWQTSDLDIHSVERLAHALGNEMERLGIGQVAVAPWLSQADRRWTTDPLVSAHPIGGYHHMGTTRMAASAREGVVDAQCRVHGLNNLYVAGSSVFPTSGWANPTFTIAALSLRTADHIIRCASRESLAPLEIDRPLACGQA